MQGKSNKRVALFALAALALAGGAYHFFFRAPAGPEGGMMGGGPGGFALPVEAARLQPEKLEVTLATVGSMRSNESVILRPEIGGRVEKILFEEGAAAKKGDVLIVLDDRLPQSELQQAEAQLKLARLSQARARKLKESGAVSQSRLDQANADLGVAAAAAGLARAKLDKTRIIAPFDGVAGLRRVSPGDYVNVGQDLANFESFDPMKVDFSIPEVYAPLLKTGQALEIGVDALPGKSFTGTVYALDPQVEAGGRSMALRATVANPDNVLKPGYFARVNLIAETKENALMVPESAIVPKGAEMFVFAVDKENKVALRKVELGVRREGRVEVTSGLNAGDVVVTAGQMKLQEGMPVTARVAGETAG